VVFVRRFELNLEQSNSGKIFGGWIEQVGDKVLFIYLGLDLLMDFNEILIQ
jgi:hypothetical protein